MQIQLKSAYSLYGVELRAPKNECFVDIRRGYDEFGLRCGDAMLWFVRCVARVNACNCTPESNDIENDYGIVNRVERVDENGVSFLQACILEPSDELPDCRFGVY